MFSDSNKKTGMTCPFNRQSNQKVSSGIRAITPVNHKTNNNNNHHQQQRMKGRLQNIPKTQKMTKISPKPKNDQNTPEIQKMTKLPPKPKK